MSIKNDQDIASSAKDLLKRAREAALAKNYEYAISLLQTILKSEPLFLDGRRLLRKVGIEKSQSQRASFFGKGPNLTALAKLNGINKKSPQEQLEIAEEILKDDPFNEAANQVIADAGEALGEPTFKAFAQEIVVEGKPNDPKALKKLCQIYLDLNEPDQANAVAEKLVELNPNDAEANTLLKETLASVSLKHDYDGKAFPESIKNPGQRETGSQMSSDAIDRAIRELKELILKEPNNLNHPKEMGRLSLKKGDLAEAIRWYTNAYELGQSIDSALEETINDLTLKQIDKSIANANAVIESAQDEEARAGAQYAKEQWEQYRKQVHLETAHKMVRKYPQDGEYHFQLGKALFEAGHYKDGLKELQASLKQSSVRLRALNLIGQSYLALNMFDLAIARLSVAVSELSLMDDLKKDLLYNLGKVYDAMGEKAKGLDQYKTIYVEDITYRDVAEKVEGSYAVKGLIT